MRYWDTSDDPTNANLTYLESIAQDRSPTFDAEQVNDKFGAVISMLDVLPKAVLRHFDFPSLYIGGSAVRWSAERRAAEVEKLRKAIADGLDKIAADDCLIHRGTADLSDRKRTRGEVILEALAKFKALFPQRDYSGALTSLRQASFGTSVQRRVDEIDKILARKRWPGPTSKEYEVYRQIGDIEFYAAHYHREAA